MSGTISPRDRLQLWVNTFLLEQKENSGSVTATFREEPEKKSNVDSNGQKRQSLSVARIRLWPHFLPVLLRRRRRRQSYQKRHRGRLDLSLRVHLV